MLLTEAVGTGAEIDGERVGGCKGRGSCAETSEKQNSLYLYENDIKYIKLVIFTC